MKMIRCPHCNRLLLKAKGKGQVKCPKCKKIVGYDTFTNKISIIESA